MFGEHVENDMFSCQGRSVHWGSVKIVGGGIMCGPSADMAPDRSQLEEEICPIPFWARGFF